MQSIHLSGLLIQPVAERIRGWNAEGKITEDDLERALTTDGRALVDHSMGQGDWAPLEDVEGLVGLVAEQVGGETGLVEWAEEIVECWRKDEPIEGLIRSSRALVDSPGFVVSQASELLVRNADWLYDGGRSVFSVRVRGMREASPALKSLLGALLARLAVAPEGRDFDVRFDGIDSDDLVVFGEALSEENADGESRLHQAALIA